MLNIELLSLCDVKRGWFVFFKVKVGCFIQICKLLRKNCAFGQSKKQFFLLLEVHRAVKNKLIRVAISSVCVVDWLVYDVISLVCVAN